MKDPIMTEHPDGSRKWHANGRLHRLDGPAVEYPERRLLWLEEEEQRATGSYVIEKYEMTREWWVNGYRHRLDGPAIERANGFLQWWVNGFAIGDAADLAVIKSSHPHLERAASLWDPYRRPSLAQLCDALAAAEDDDDE